MFYFIKNNQKQFLIKENKSQIVKKQIYKYIKKYYNRLL